MVVFRFLSLVQDVVNRAMFSVGGDEILIHLVLLF